MKKYFFIRSNGVSKNPSFHTDFKNVHMTLVKSAPEKRFAQNTNFLGLRQTFNWENSFWAKTFLCALFTKFICTFLKSARKDGFFYAPFDLFKENKFSSLRRDNELFWKMKKVTMEETAQNFEKLFLETGLRVSLPFQSLCHTSNLWNFVKITGP